ncbi:helix-turn-helix domain-containing protein [Paenibacillus polymyxa]|uniref:helix-turn-helix domain-containing protein n=2 Tax=Paenibacillus TaxID=44249 RepID=UPI000D83CE66|nr:helix-turn-helix domain-containing protein [Paenibacillus polymyxa]MBZ6445917.1 helix-turn-helix domain-containing protein [Paenibacillus polymyxa]MBZ6451956.1 helix-turn-helix domain-containing protein [Paenibacillus polymyxa]MDU8676056.1 helix-turn-helix domain-containing protein [Paenibacillus polymyxa]UQQ37584.1 helix-turn-helix domain-containing protein [Paenibacillus polymyxa]URJ72387.1 helix-turn-helix domain-containing protein [Paenibacillus polymyxa]
MILFISHTLMAFLHNGQHTAKTSSELNIHKNTLLYRVNKIKKLLNSSLDEGDELFSYQLPFKILDYMSSQL